MIESFVDLTYRGLSLGRRIKLTQVRPTTGYLEHPTPMPVGTAVGVVTDDGMTFDAVVMHVHEQVGGSDRAPGMTVKPALADERLAAWWKDRVTLPELEPTRPQVIERSRPVTVRPRSHTIPQPPPAGAIVEPTTEIGEITQPTGATPSPVVNEQAPVARIDLVRPPPTPPPIIERNQMATGELARQTTIMPAADQELLEQLTRSPDDLEQLVRRTGEHEVVDDGKMTTLMDAIDPAALGLDVASSGSMAAQGDDEEGDDEPADGNGNGNGNGTAGNGNGADKKPRGKRRKKRR